MIAYADLPSGLSGDMFLACLVDAGWPIEALRDTLVALDLPPDSWSVEQFEVMRGPLRATQILVRVNDRQPHRNLNDISTIIGDSALPAPVRPHPL